MNDLESVGEQLLSLVHTWERKLLALPEDVVSERRNRQNRTITQIVGHMVDSASNNTHRIVHLQYQPSPLVFPDYANLGNNDRWIAIQNYQDEDWTSLVQLWKYSNIHIAHVMRNADQAKLKNEWISALDERISLEAMIRDFPRHFLLHLGEIDELMNTGRNP